jgi:riboflavin synthase
MFTGIIDHCGKILKIETIPSGIKLKIQTQFKDLELGESIAINGMCLTVTEFDATSFCCDISPESLNVTTSKNFQENQKINLERALQLSSRLGGHLVSGHVDQMCYVKSIRHVDAFIEMIFAGLENEANVLMIKKGSITVNGVSLTINDVSNDGFSVMLIPHTLERTQLADLREKDAVNIEFDMMARIIAEQSRVYRQ